MGKKKKKSTIDWKTLTASAILDLVIGIILMILDRIW